jgi:ribose 5-phosphate isomerase A
VETKKLAGRYAADLVESGWDLGLGTGSTVHFALERLSERIHAGNLKVRGIPTSVDTETKCRELGIPLIGFTDVTRLDMCIDGADEVDPGKRLIKGGGGALVREKIVAAAAKEMIVIVGENKMVDRLGVDFLLPVEVIPFAMPLVIERLEALGCHAYLRTCTEGEAILSDNDNRILDCRFEGIDDPEQLEIDINMIPGVVDNGLFCGLADRIIVGTESGEVQVR